MKVKSCMFVCMYVGSSFVICTSCHVLLEWSDGGGLCGVTFGMFRRAERCILCQYDEGLGWIN